MIFTTPPKNFSSTAELRKYFINAVKNQLQSEIGYGSYLSEELIAAHYHMNYQN